MGVAVDWLERRASITPNKIALIDAVTEERVTFSQWNERANLTANFLREYLDVGVGDRVAVLSMNNLEYLDLLFACNKLGCILQNLNWRLAAPELDHLIEHAQPKALFYGEEFIDVVGRLKAIGGRFPDRYVAIEKAHTETDLLFGERERCSADTPPNPNISWEAPWLLCYTGGTTGLPKGVIISHRHMVWNASNTMSSGVVSSNDLCLMNMPLFHVSGINCFAAPLVYSGGTSIVGKAFDIDFIYEVLENYALTILMAVPTIYIAMQNHPRWATTNFSKLRYIVSGGAPCPDSVMEKFWEKDAKFCVGYGLTEAGPSNFFLPWEEQKTKAGSLGYPLMNVEVQLVDGENRRIDAPLLEGELVIRGYHCTVGYWNNPGASNKLIDKDGWLHTGDVAVRDEDGAYWVVGRLSDMYISGGENVYPAEVESVMIAHPDIVDVAVFGVPDAYWGEVGCAVVHFNVNAMIDGEEIKEWMKDRIARYKIPKIFHFVDELPKTGAGKINKESLRQRYIDA